MTVETDQRNHEQRTTVRRWIPPRMAIALGVLTTLAVAASWPIWVDIFTLGWEVDEQSHVLLALPIAAWLAWHRRERLRRWEQRHLWVGPLVVLGGYAMARYGFANGYQVFWHGGGIAMVIGAILSIVGIQAAWRLAPAFGALAFLLPVPGRLRVEIALPLQEASARATYFFMDLFGAPVTRVGNSLTINGQTVAVAEACNGMRMVAAMALIAYAFVFTVQMRLSVRLLILAISPLIAVVVNVLRLVPTVLFYGYLDHEMAGFLHDISGWLSLLMALGLLWGLIAILRWIEVPLMPYAVSEG